MINNFDMKGPLGGIHAAMKYVKTPFLFVVSRDMPDIDVRVIEKHVKLFSSLPNADALVPKISSNTEPLHAIYRTQPPMMLF